MGMTHSTSGKRGFELYGARSPQRPNVDRETMKMWLAVEEHLRFDSEWQNAYTAAGDDIDDLAEVTRQLQLEALRNCNRPEDTLEADLETLHRARHDFAGDEELLQTAVYHRTDHAFGTPGEIAPFMNTDIELTRLDGTTFNLRDYYFDPSRQGRALVLVGGSLT